MARLPRYPKDYQPTGDDLNHLLSILDAGLSNADPIISGIVGNTLTPTVPNLGGAVNPGTTGVGALTVPQGLTGSSGIDNFSQTHTAYVVLSWTPNPLSDFVTRYDIYYHLGSNPTLYTQSVGGNITSTRINNLFPGNTYSFSVRATDAADRRSAWCPEINVTVSLDSDAPATPNGLTATSAGKGVFLNWVEVGLEGLSNDLKQYEIGISLTSTFSNVISGQRRITVPSLNVAGNPTPWIITVGPGNSYFYAYPGSNTTLYFRIRAVDWTGNKSGWSSIVSATTGGGGISWADISSGAPSSSMTGGLTITTGGITITSGGATVTGGISTDTLTASGSITAGVPGLLGTWTKYRARATNSVNQTIGQNGTVKVVLDVLVYDPNGNFDNITNYRYTAPVTGYYQFSYSARLSMGSQVGWLDLWIKKNGTTDITGSQSSSGQAGSSGIVSGASNTVTINLTAGDYIELWAINNASIGGSTLLGGAIPGAAHLTVQFVGI